LVANQNQSQSELDLDFEISSKELLGYVSSFSRNIQRLESHLVDTATILVEEENISPIADYQHL